MNRTRFAICILIGVLAHPAMSDAQGLAEPPLQSQLIEASPDSSLPPRAFSQQLGLHGPAKSNVRANGAAEISADPLSDDQLNPANHIVLGAVIGAVALGGFMAMQVSNCEASDSCMFAGPAVYVSAGAGAILGGVAGLIVYAVRESNRADHAQATSRPTMKGSRARNWQEFRQAR
jgi:hypothetical protein